MKAEPVDDAVLADTKSHMRYGFAMGLDNPASIAETLGHYLQLTEDPETVNRVYRLYDAVSPGRHPARGHHLLPGNKPDRGRVDPGGGGMMRRWIAPVAAVALSVLALGCGSSAPSEESSLTSVGLRTPNSPLISIRIVFRTGSIDDPAGKNGLNALTALMIGQGGTQTLSYEELTTAVYPWSASLTAQFDKEMTTIIGQVHRDHVEPFYAILRDLITAPRFDESDFDRNREFLTNAVVSSLRGNDDEELGKQTLNALMYEGHPYAAPEIGTELGLGAITLNDVRDFHGQRYTRDNFLVGVAGGYPAGFVQQIEGDLAAGLPPGDADPAVLPASPDAERPGGTAGREASDRDGHLDRVPDRGHQSRRRLLCAAGCELVPRRAPDVQRSVDEQDAWRPRTQSTAITRTSRASSRRAGSRFPVPNIPSSAAVLQYLDPAGAAS